MENKANQAITKKKFDALDLKLFQIEAMRKWAKDAPDCPMREPTIQAANDQSVKPDYSCGVGGWRPGGFRPCEFFSCFARFAKNIPG